MSATASPFWRVGWRGRLYNRTKDRSSRYRLVVDLSRLPVVRQGNTRILPHDRFRLERLEGHRWRWIGHSIPKQFISELVAEMLCVRDLVRACAADNKGGAA